MCGHGLDYGVVFNGAVELMGWVFFVICWFGEGESDSLEGSKSKERGHVGGLRNICLFLLLVEICKFGI